MSTHYLELLPEVVVPADQVFVHKDQGNRIAQCRRGKVAWWRLPSGERDKVIGAWDVHSERNVWIKLGPYQHTRQAVKNDLRLQKASSFLSWKRLSAERVGPDIIIKSLDNAS